jgi:hypothetical protein
MRAQLVAALAALVLSAGMTLAAEPWEDPEELEVLPEPDTDYYRYLKARKLKCTDDEARLDKSVEMMLGSRKYTYTGPELVATKPDPDGVVTLGVLGAVKDFNPETVRALRFYLRRFQKAKADAIVLLGDVAGVEYELTQVLLFCAKTRLPVLALIGNSESRTAFNRAVLAALKAAPHIVNLDFVRKVDLGGAVLVSLPGYRDRKFVHQTAGCAYKPKDIQAMSRLVKGATSPVVFLAHGPPKDAGRQGLDFATEGGNVGDPVMADFLRDEGIRFGIFSHILEAGGQAHNGRGKRVRPGKWVRALQMNVGSANPLPWQLNNAKLSCGLAAVVRIKGKKASYTWIRSPCRR